MKINFLKLKTFSIILIFMMGIAHAQIQNPGNYNASGNINSLIPNNDIADYSPLAPLLYESFNSTTFPPAGWTNAAGIGTYVWERVTAGTHPTCTPHSGSGMILYNSYTSSSGNYATLTTPSVNLTGNTGFYIVKMWMYHDDGFSNDDDQVKIFVNTAPNLNSATLLGTVNRYSSTVGWAEHSFNIPAAYNSTTNYFIFKAISDYGNDIHVDDISIIKDVQDVGITSIISPEVGMLPGSVVPQVIVKNFGSFPQTNIPVSYKIDTNGTVSTITIPSLAAGGTTSVSFPSWNGDLGAYNFIFYTNLADDDILANDTMKRTLNVVNKLNRAFCFKDNNQPSSFILENPIGGFTNFGSTVPWMSRAGVYFSTSETGYKWLVIGNDKNLYSVDTLNGTVNFLGPTGVSDLFLTGLTYDKSTHTLYASSLSGSMPNYTFKLYTVNQSNGSATLVATSPNTGFFSEIACNTFGQLYAIEYRPDSTGRLYSLDKNTAALTLIGTNLGGRISSNPQDIEFTDNNILYFTASMGYDGVLDGLYTINTTTGKATLVSTFRSNNTPVVGLGIKTTFGASIPKNGDNRNAIRIFPNPIKDYVSIISDNNEIIKSVQVISISGQIVYSEKVEHIATTINTSEMKAGFYFIQILTNAGMVTKKIVVTE